MTDNKAPAAHQQPPIIPRQQQWASLADRLNPNRPAFDAQLKSSWKSLSKKEKKRIITQDRQAIKALKSRGTSQSLPFEVDTDDHCETSHVAYAHVAPILTYIAEQLGKTPNNLQIYDPYYCAGTVVQHLNKLGFENVYNQPEDFYQVIQDGCVPQHDVLVTNPPYSGDHFERLLKFCSQNNKPALLLIPDHLSKKKYVKDYLDKYFFLAPAERYFYWTPEGLRPNDGNNDTDDKNNSKKKKKNRQHKNLMLGTRNSPFASHWFISTNPVVSNDKIISLIRSAEINLLDGCNVYERQEDIVQETSFRKRKEAEQNESEARCGNQQTEEEGEKKRQRKKKRTQKGTSAPAPVIGDGSNPFF